MLRAGVGEAFAAAHVAEDFGALLYGVITGLGDAEDAVLSDRARSTRPRGLWTAASFGKPPESVVRAIVLARLANLLDGHAGALPSVAVASAVGYPVAATTTGGLGRSPG